MALLIKKLNAKLGVRSLVYRAPDDIRSTLVQEKPDFKTRLSGGEYAFLILFVKSAADAANYLPNALDHILDHSILWVATPKFREGEREEERQKILHELKAVEAAGFVPVSSISLTSEWAAYRFKHQSQFKDSTVSVEPVELLKISGRGKLKVSGDDPSVKPAQKGVELDERKTAQKDL